MRRIPTAFSGCTMVHPYRNMPLKKNIIELTRISTDDYRHAPKLPVALMADNVRSMHNIGSMLRTCDAFSVEEMIMCGISGTPPHPEISKTALGADRSVRWRHADDAFAEAVRLREEGWKVLVLEQAHDSVELADFEPAAGERYLLVAGNEVDGVDQRIVDIADTVLEIPQCGTKHSLNVAVSAGIALFHLFTKMRKK